MIPVHAAPVAYDLDEQPAFTGFMAAPRRPDSVTQARGRTAGTEPWLF